MTDPFAVGIWLVALLLGLVVGSFLTVVVYRVPRHESLVRPRSRCPGCGHQVRARDNVPVVSWLILRGRCRDCGEHVSVRYPLTESANGALWLAAAVWFSEDLFLIVVFACFFSLLLAVSLIDMEYRIIPNAIVYPAVPAFAVALAAARLLGSPVDLPSAAVGFVAYGGVLLLIAMAYPKGMGMGDVKLVALVGMVVGSLGLGLVAVAAFLGFFLGAVGGILLMLFAGRGRKAAVPFGPYLAAGAVLAVFVGEPIASWYLGLFG